MPHLTIQTTPNVTIFHEEALLKALNQALWESGHFKKPTDIKSRLIPLKTFLVGVNDDEQTHGFVYAHLKLMAGRTQEERGALAQLLQAVLEQQLAAEQSSRTSLQICAEVEELSPIYSKKILGE